MSERSNDYLWEKSGPPDPEVLRLEELLGRYRYEVPGAAPAEPAAPVTAPRPVALRTLRPIRPIRIGVAVAASIAAAVLIVWAVTERANGAGYRVIGVAGQDLARAGDEISTGAGNSARVEIGWLGHVEVAPGSKLRVEDCGRDAHRLYLERGAVEARIWARPRLFQIGTPSGNTIDLGCAYRLEVTDDERSILRVTSGQVAFDFQGREVYVPAGAMCVSVPGRGPGAPVFEDAPSMWRAAVEAVQFADHPDPELVKTVLDVRREDTLTIWHLLTSSRTAPALRHAAFERLAAILAKPKSVTEAGILAGDAAMREAWLEELKPAWRSAQ